VKKEKERERKKKRGREREKKRKPAGTFIQVFLISASARCTLAGYYPGLLGPPGYESR